ncbi:hypothetical protein L596_011177 [Steinernema carpocapsae]|uniref:Uncharacterized protein n=1 Tax=Steinernema carpocapsae TaxID=34508 RepID=A0A4U5NTK7_STECR|nr:hypothetical protein L596_011177 [Steinernema carpocapsae]
MEPVTEPPTENLTETPTEAPIEAPTETPTTYVQSSETLSLETTTETPTTLAPSTESYKSSEKRFKIDEDPPQINNIEPPPPPSNDDLLNEVNDLLEESKREALLLSQLVEEITKMSSIALATNGKSKKVQEGLPDVEVNAVDQDGRPSFEDIDLAEDFADNKAQAVRNYGTHPLVEKLEEQLQIPIHVVRIELSTLPVSISSSSSTTTTTTTPATTTSTLPPTTQTSRLPTTFATFSTRFHKTVNFTDLLERKQIMVPPATLSPAFQRSLHGYTVNFFAKNLMKNFMKAHKEMKKRVTAKVSALKMDTPPPATTTQSSATKKVRSRTLDMLLQQIKENQEKKKTHQVMPVVKKLLRKFVKTKAAKTHRQGVGVVVTARKKMAAEKLHKLIKSKIVKTTISTTAPTTTTENPTTTAETTTSSEFSAEKPGYIDVDVEAEDNFKLDGDTAAGSPQEAIVDSETVEDQRNPKLKGLANFHARKAFLEDIISELGTNMSEEITIRQSTTTSTPTYRYVEDVYGDVRVVGSQSRTTRKPANVDYVESSAEATIPTTTASYLGNHESLISKPVVRIRTTELERLDARVVSDLRAKMRRRGSHEVPVQVRVPSLRSKWTRRFKVLPLRRIPIIRRPLDH